MSAKRAAVIPTNNAVERTERLTAIIAMLIAEELKLKTLDLVLINKANLEL